MEAHGVGAGKHGGAQGQDWAWGKEWDGIVRGTRGVTGVGLEKRQGEY